MCPGHEGLVRVIRTFRSFPSLSLFPYLLPQRPREKSREGERLLEGGSVKS